MRPRRSAIAKNRLSVSELSDSSTINHCVSDGPFSWQMVLSLPGVPTSEPSLFRISLRVTATQTAGAVLHPLPTAQTFWCHDHVEKANGESPWRKPGKQETVYTAKLRLQYSLLSSFSSHTHWGTGGHGARIKEVTIAYFSIWKQDLPNSFFKKQACSPECEATTWYWGRAGV